MGDSPRNVVLIILDCVRKDYFDEYAPRLQDLSDVSFEQCRAASSWSPPSHASMMTGKLPHQHGVHSGRQDFSKLADSDLFTSDLPDYRTLAVNANPAIGRHYGFGDLFDEYVETVVLDSGKRYPSGMDLVRDFDPKHGGPVKVLEYLVAAARHDHTLASLLNAVTSTLNDVASGRPVPKPFDDGASVVSRCALDAVGETDEPFFLFTNFLDAHHHYQHVRGFDRRLHSAPNSFVTSAYEDRDVNLSGSHDGYETYLERRRGLYAAAVDYLDRTVSTFVEDLLETTERPTTVVVTSDHGDNLGYEADGGLVHHKGSTSEALMHVPFEIVNPPDGYGERETAYFSHLRLGDLLTGMARGETPDVFAERIPAERVGTYSWDRFVEFVDTLGYDWDADRIDEEYAYWDRMIRCVYEGGDKYEWDSTGGQYHLTLDESRPCWQSEPEDASPPAWADVFFDEPLEAYKDRVTRAEDEAVDVDEATADRLRSLGYL